MKKDCEKIVDNNGNQLSFKLYPPLWNVAKGVILPKGRSVLEYCVNLNTSSKPKHSLTSLLKPTTLVK